MVDIFCVCSENRMYCLSCEYPRTPCRAVVSNTLSPGRMVESWAKSPLQYLAGPLFGLLRLLLARCRCCCLLLVAGILYLHHSVNGQLEHFIHTFLLLTRALDVFGIHLSGDRFALFRCHWSETLSSKEFDAGTLSTEVGLETDKDQRCGWAEVHHFRVPLNRVSRMSQELRIQGSCYLIHHVLQRVRAVYGEANKQQIRLRV